MMIQQRERITRNLKVQIARLEASVGEEGIKQAREIVETHEPDVIRLAFKMIPKTQGVTVGLGKRIEALLGNVPEAKRAEMRNALLQAKADLKPNRGFPYP